MRLRILPGKKGLLRLAVLSIIIAVALGAGIVAMFRMPGESYRGPFVPLEDSTLAESLRRHVERLAVTIGERNVWRQEKLEEAASWIEEELRGLGYEVAREEYIAGDAFVRNLLVQVQGGDRSGEIVVVGAHYDSVFGSPGANDNATGVAGLIELARAFKGTSPRRVLRFVAFANEEPPFFQTEEMGSRVHARAARLREEKIVAMISLETMGYYSDEKGSQVYPPFLRLLYPDTGNFIGFVGSYGSRALVRDSIRIFRETTPFPSEGGAPPAKLPGVGWSDHWSFWQEGYPAMMVTDTAPFRYPHYHTAEDTPEKIDYDRLARVVAGLIRVVDALANRD